MHIFLNNKFSRIELYIINAFRQRTIAFQLMQILCIIAKSVNSLHSHAKAIFSLEFP